MADRPQEHDLWATLLNYDPETTGFLLERRLAGVDTMAGSRELRDKLIAGWIVVEQIMEGEVDG